MKYYPQEATGSVRVNFVPGELGIVWEDKVFNDLKSRGLIPDQAVRTATLVTKYMDREYLVATISWVV